MMNNEVVFETVKEKYLKKLEQFVPIVDRVHGDSHPEFHEVKAVFSTMAKKINESNTVKPNIDEEFSQLRKITDQYTVPGNVCETYEAVYKMLKELDDAYRN